MKRQAEAKSTTVDHDKEFGLNPNSNGKQPVTNFKQKGVIHSDFIFCEDQSIEELLGGDVGRQGRQSECKETNWETITVIQARPQ